ncbi:sugar synthetase, partial [bacterium]|nr:sugar synthetase [bacterium]
ILVEDKDYSERKNLRLAIASSGTASFENAMLGIPTVIMYKTSFISYAIAKQLVKTKFIGMPNILAGKSVAPEFVQTDARAYKILHEIKHMLKNDNAIRASEELLKLRPLLDKKNAEKNVLGEIEKELKGMI